MLHVQDPLADEKYVLCFHARMPHSPFGDLRANKHERDGFEAMEMEISMGGDTRVERATAGFCL
jgi:hypothetical protein